MALFPTFHPSVLPADISVMDTVAHANILLNAFRVAIHHGLSVFSMVDGIVDELEDETGVTTSTNATYDSSGDYYHNPGSVGMVAGGTGTIIGDMNYSGLMARGFDGTTSYAIWSGACQSAGQQAYLGKDWGSGVTKNITRYLTWGSSNYGYSAGSPSNGDHYIDLYGSNSVPSSATDGTLIHHEVVVDTASGVNPQDITVDTPGADYRYHWLRIYRVDGSDSLQFSEVRLYETIAPPDMTLISDPFTAEVEPDEAHIVLWEEDVDAPTLNTDLKAFASRDGGTTYTEAVLAEAATISTGRILTATIDISAQPSGTTMHWKVTTHNNKELRVHGVALEWS